MTETMGRAWLSRPSTAFTICCSTILALILFEIGDAFFPRPSHVTVERITSSLSLPGYIQPKTQPVDHAWGSILRPFEKEVLPQRLNLHKPPSADRYRHVNRKQVRVLLAIAELSGLHKNGGIGTAYRSLAEALTAEGFSVSVLMLHARETFPSFVVRSMAEKMREANITLQYLPPVSSSSVGTFPTDWASRMSLHVYDHLKRLDGDYDIIQFHDNHGHGYHTLLAKQQGIAFQNTKFIIGMHGPNTGWATLLNGEYPMSEDHLITDHLERRACEMADVIVSPSEYILNYLSLRGWHFPPKQMVIWNLAGDRKSGVSPDVLKARQLPATEVRNIVFYGRLEARKGIKVFLAAIDSLVETDAVHQFSPTSPLTISFLGRDTIDADGTSNGADIEKHGISWRNSTSGKVTYKIVSGKNREAALNYLKAGGTLAVMPSLIDNSPYTVMECIAHGIDFIAAAVGGIPELVSSTSASQALFQPNPESLSAKLRQKLEQHTAQVHVTPPHSFEDSTRDWVGLHLELFSSVERVKASGYAAYLETPHRETVSVCLLYDGQTTKAPMQLLDSLHSLVLQTVTPLSVSIYANLPRDYPDTTEDHSYSRSILAMTDRYKWKWVDMSSLSSPVSHCAHASPADYMFALKSGDILHPAALEAFLNVSTHGHYDVVSSAIATIQGAGGFSEQCVQRKSKVCKTVKRECFFGDALSVGLISNKLGPESFLVDRKLVTSPTSIRHHFDTSSAGWEFYVRMLSQKKSVTMLSHTYLARREASSNDLVTSAFAMNNWLKEYQAFSPLLDHGDIASSNLSPFLMYAKGLVQAHVRPAIRPLAHSKDDFSSFQGYHGWQYGFQDMSQPIEPFKEPSFFHGDSWHHPDVVDAPLFISKEGMHPYRSQKEGIAYGAVRSWRCPANLDNALLKLDYEGFHSCGDGTTIRLLVEDRKAATFTEVYSGDTFDAGPISWATPMNLTQRMTIHLMVEPKLSSDCDHVNAALRIMPPVQSLHEPSKKFGVPLEVLRQRHSRTLTDTANNFALHKHSYSVEDLAELSNAFCWKYRFFEVESGEVMPGKVNSQGTAARIEPDMEIPYISEWIQHPSSQYSTSRYGRLKLREDARHVLLFKAHYPKGFCETYCGDGVKIELYVDGKVVLSKHLGMSETIEEKVNLPQTGAPVEIDMRTYALKDDWFDAVEVHAKVRQL